MYMTYELAKRIEQSDLHVLHARLSAIQEREGNPMGIHIRSYGEAVAFISAGIPGPSFNTVRGITSEHIEVLDEILAFYKEHDVSCQFEIAPTQLNNELASALHKKGYYQSSFHTALYGVPCPQQLVHNALTIRKLEKDEFNQFASIYTKGFGMPDFTLEGVRQNNEILHGKEGWEVYVACLEEQPVSIGVMYVANNIATLAASATLPDYQRKGAHQLLLRKRIDHAYTLGCDLVVAQASFGSISQQNMQRVGLEVAYTKGIWRRV
ncbi:GNAT family N-acetyltransferase [Priestia taiwanensis]|uniref:N-acetyltransferase n=1 Tax=Priestia taiwanensis TaxID=1347902 RepID=A0A917ENQ3_9BACI|nr:GNAT family N-acetyltransferase [Priestia taiwanensis]MBM7362259.1 GNAT superfamily N-acetyltransferase [Priestia taiwanensis]GGE60768.1 N-acetyltransferase [Priestia taiwanensis]